MGKLVYTYTKNWIRKIYNYSTCLISIPKAWYTYTKRKVYRLSAYISATRDNKTTAPNQKNHQNNNNSFFFLLWIDEFNEIHDILCSLTTSNKNVVADKMETNIEKTKNRFLSEHLICIYKQYIQIKGERYTRFVFLLFRALKMWNSKVKSIGFTKKKLKILSPLDLKT